MNNQLSKFEEKSLDMCVEVIKYIDAHNTFPKITDESTQVRKLANWLTSMRGAKSNHSKRILYPSVIQLAIECGYPELFNKTKFRGSASQRMTRKELYYSREGKAIKIWHELTEFIENYRIFPYRIYSKHKYMYEEEFYSTCNRLYHWMSSMRRANANKGTRVLYPSLKKLVKSSRYSNIFTNHWKKDLGQ